MKIIVKLNERARKKHTILSFFSSPFCKFVCFHQFDIPLSSILALYCSFSRLFTPQTTSGILLCAIRFKHQSIH